MNPFPFLTQVQSLHKEIGRLTAERDAARSEAARLRGALDASRRSANQWLRYGYLLTPPTDQGEGA